MLISLPDAFKPVKESQIQMIKTGKDKRSTEIKQNTVGKGRKEASPKRVLMKN